MGNGASVEQDRHTSETHKYAEGPDSAYALTLTRTMTAGDVAAPPASAMAPLAFMAGKLLTHMQANALSKLTVETTVEERVTLLQQTPLGKSLTLQQLTIMAQYFVKVRVPGMRKVRQA